MAALWLGMHAASAAEAVSPRPDRINIALGKPASFPVAPNYGLTADPGDAQQLTDGAFAPGPKPMWHYREAVGWRDAEPSAFIIDLGERRPIGGIAVHSGAGAADVAPPERLFVYVDDIDGKFHYVGDIVAEAREKPPADRYRAWWWVADNWMAYGQRVAVVASTPATANGMRHYFMIDEVEIYRGDPAWPDTPPPTPGVADPVEEYRAVHREAPARQRLRRDAQAMREAWARLTLAAEPRARLEKQLSALETAIDAPEAVHAPADGKTVLPLGPSHSRLMALHGEALAAAGAPPLAMESQNPWALAPYVAAPPDGGAPARVDAMRGEIRPVVVALLNASGDPMRVRLRFENLPPRLTPERVYSVEWIDDSENTPRPLALREAVYEDGSYAVDVPAGTTRQLWLSFRPAADAPAGEHAARLVARADGADGARAALPLTVRVFDLAFPEVQALHIGGWDYTHAGAQRGVTLENRAALIALLREYGVDTPWAAPGILSPGTYDGEGRQTRPPNWSRLDVWLDRWPGAARYALYMHLGPKFGGHDVAAPAGARAVGEWLRSTAAHVRDRGLRPEQFLLQPTDEPGHAASIPLTVAWGRAIALSESGFRTWMNPAYGAKDDAGYKEGVFDDDGLSDAYDILCVSRHAAYERGEKHLAPFLRARERGKTLEVYACAGPAHSLDPYAYYRLQAWFAFDIGAIGSHFWSFGDNGRYSDWKRYDGGHTSYTPLFLDGDSATPAKGLEAIRAGAQDYQYLVMLHEAQARLAAAGRDDDARRADALLKASMRQVLDAPGAREYRQHPGRSYLEADAARIVIAEFLEGR